MSFKNKNTYICISKTDSLILFIVLSGAAEDSIPSFSWAQYFNINKSSFPAKDTFLLDFVSTKCLSYHRAFRMTFTLTASCFRRDIRLLQHNNNVNYTPILVTGCAKNDFKPASNASSPS